MISARLDLLSVLQDITYRLIHFHVLAVIFCLIGSQLAFVFTVDHVH